MATATDLTISSPTYRLSITSLPKAGDVESLSPPRLSFEGQDGNTSPSAGNSSTQSAEYWASLLRQAFNALGKGGTLDKDVLKRLVDDMQDSAALAHKVAGIMYPSYSDSKVPQVITYEKYIVLLRRAIQAKQKADGLVKAEARHQPEWKRRILRQGP